MVFSMSARANREQVISGVGGEPHMIMAMLKENLKFNRKSSRLFMERVIYHKKSSLTRE